MTTTDIRVIRPAVERYLGCGTTTCKSLHTIIIRFLLENPSIRIPLLKVEVIGFVRNLMKDGRFRQYAEREHKLTVKHFNKNPEHVCKFVEEILMEGIFNSFFALIQQPIHSYFSTPEKDRNVYVFEGRFFDQFSQIEIKHLKSSFLPKSGCGCLVFPRPINIVSDNTAHNSINIDEIIFSIGPTSYLLNAYQELQEDLDTKPNYARKPPSELVEGDFIYAPEDGTDLPGILSIIGCDSQQQSIASVAQYDIGKDHDLADSIKKQVATGNVSKDAEYILKLTLNLLAYISTGRPDIREFQNIIRYRGKSSVHVRKEDADLSRSKIFLVGFNWLKNPIYTIDGWHSKGYSAWRMCGPGRTEPRLVTFSPSFKQRRKGRENIVKEEDAAEEDYTPC